MKRAALALLSVALASCQGHTSETQPAPSPRELNFSGRATAITPAEAGRVSSLKLTARIPRLVRRSCRAARTFTCPRRVPAGGIVPIADTSGLLESGPDLYDLSFNNGTNRGYYHWVVGAGTSAAVSRQLIDDRTHEGKGLPKRIRLLRLDKTRIAVYRFPGGNGGGYLSGHTAAFADTGRRVVFASVHGHRHEDADIALVTDMLTP